jgi:phosphoglycolate phosphatase-like HAD superfamily hydrolase
MAFNDDFVLLHRLECSASKRIVASRLYHLFLCLPANFPILARMSQDFSGLIEFAASFEPRPDISHVVFDFDGTLSLIREGWPVVMLGMFQEMLPGKGGDTSDAVRQMLFDDMMKLNGKQTIYQMMQFAERVKERGGAPQEPLWYKHEYLCRLNQKIEDRIVGLKNKSIDAEKYLVFGSIALLEDLKQRGMKLYLASGTDEQFVKAEAELLGLTKYFGEHIYGAKDDYKSFSKKMVIDRLLRENGIDGRKLLAFGDGYVEIQNTKEVGGLAIAVASDEACNGSGRIDEWKRNRLVGVGADVVIPDYRDAAPLLRKILCK